ncbi:cell division inhibitor SepF [Virgibacillus chiguensis]|nr:cell division inhibitor SepF [Virgibacillus chiguensis]
MEDEYEYEYVDADQFEAEQALPKEKHKNVVNLTSVNNPTSKVVLCEPRTYSEAQEIADNIVNRRAVVINLQRMENQQAMRIVDFLSGTVYAVNGDIQKLGAKTFLCTPDNVNVTGSITDTLEEEYGKGW